MGPEANADSEHWRLFNIMVRLFGLMALAAGLVALEWALNLTIHPAMVRTDETLGLPENVLDVIVGILAGTIGVLMLTSRPYRPDLGDRALSDRAFRLLRGLPSTWARPQRAKATHRAWWTGDPNP